MNGRALSHFVMLGPWTLPPSVPDEKGDKTQGRRRSIHVEDGNDVKAFHFRLRAQLNAIVISSSAPASLSYPVCRSWLTRLSER